jgi:hypothetical protein
MSNQPPNNPVSSSLEELKKRLSQAQPVEVSQDGRLNTPADPSVSTTPQDKKTTVKPSRWYC